MSRLSIEITLEEYQKLKTLAAINRMTIKDFVLERTLKQTGDQGDPWGEIRGILAPRIESAEKGEFAEFDIESFIKEIDKKSE